MRRVPDRAQDMGPRLREVGVGSIYNRSPFVALTAGTRLGPYEIVAAIGAGGMSACGYAEAGAEASASVTRRGWGPGASGKKLAPSPCP